MILRVSMIAVFLCAAAVCNSPTEVYRIEDSSCTQRDVLIAKDQFSKDRLIRIASVFLEQVKGAQIAKLTVYTQKNLGFILRSGKGITDYSYQYWLDQYFAISPRLSEIAELLKIGDSATLRIRWGSGEIQEIPISGQNIFHRETGGFRYDLLELTIRKILPHAQNRRVVASLAIKSAEPLTSEGADEIAIYLSAQAKLRSLQVVIRSDPWFADDEAYPYVNPFIETGNPPDWESYGHTLAYYCTPTENQSACTRSIPMIDKGNN